MTLSFRVGEIPHLSSFGVSFDNDGGIPEGGLATDVGDGKTVSDETGGGVASGFLHAIAMSEAASMTNETSFFMELITALRG